jgi:hypothetical protein
MRVDTVRYAVLLELQKLIKDAATIGDHAAKDYFVAADLKAMYASFGSCKLRMVAIENLLTMLELKGERK